ncbi:hypothetical protein BH11PLA2_BH11PLA2_15660 [soil metagenome]
MAVLSAELKDWLAARTAEEKEALLGCIVSDAMKQRNCEPLPVRIAPDQPVAYVVRDHEADCRIFDEYLSQPGVIANIQRRLDNPGRMLTVEEFIDELEARAKTKSEEPAEAICS